MCKTLKQNLDTGCFYMTGPEEKVKNAGSMPLTFQLLLCFSAYYQTRWHGHGLLGPLGGCLGRISWHKLMNMAISNSVYFARKGDSYNMFPCGCVYRKVAQTDSNIFFWLCLHTVGQFLVKHCTENLQRGKCEPCPPDTYSRDPNHQTRCELCTSCSQTSGMNTMGHHRFLFPVKQNIWSKLQKGCSKPFSQQTFWLVIVGKAQALIITLTLPNIQDFKIYKLHITGYVL